MVVIADDARDLPGAVRVLPQVNEPRFPDGLLAPRAGMVEAMDAELDCSVALHRKDLERPRDQRPAHLSADVLLDRIDQARSRPGEAPLVVIELHIFGEERAER